MTSCRFASVMRYLTTFVRILTCLFVCIYIYIHTYIADLCIAYLCIAYLFIAYLCIAYIEYVCLYIMCSILSFVYSLYVCCGHGSIMFYAIVCYVYSCMLKMLISKKALSSSGGSWPLGSKNTLGSKPGISRWFLRGSGVRSSSCENDTPGARMTYGKIHLGRTPEIQMISLRIRSQTEVRVICRVCMYIYIYIYIHREREMYIYIYIYDYISVLEAGRERGLAHLLGFKLPYDQFSN